MKRLVSIFLVLVFCLSCSIAMAARKTVQKDQYYLGAMRVVRCNDSVSLREGPDKSSRVLAKVPLDAIVLYCSNNTRQYNNVRYKKQLDLFIRCEYEGQEGYILKKYLEPAPEFEPAETKADYNIMTRDEIIGEGEVVLDWQEFNVAVLAAKESIQIKNENWDYLRVGCFIDEEPIWGYTEAVRTNEQSCALSAFMGGTEDEPQVYVYDQEYGLIMLDLMDGMELWTLQKDSCPLGDASIRAVGVNTGILYVTGTDGPDPIAISSEGNVVWRSNIDDPEVYGPTEMILNPTSIEIHYESGKQVLLEYDGHVKSIQDLD